MLFLKSLGIYQTIDYNITFSKRFFIKNIKNKIFCNYVIFEDRQPKRNIFFKYFDGLTFKLHHQSNIYEFFFIY